MCCAPASAVLDVAARDFATVAIIGTQREKLLKQTNFAHGNYKRMYLDLSRFTDEVS